MYVFIYTLYINFSDLITSLLTLLFLWQSYLITCKHETLCKPFYNSFSSVQSLSHVWLFVTPMDCSMPGLPVHHQLPEFTQTHVHWVGDAIQPSHPLSPSGSSKDPSSWSFQMSHFFTSGGQRIGISASASVLPMIIPDWFPLGWTGWPGRW